MILCPWLLDNVQVKYRSKVVKYAWPMPHQAAQSVPWVRVTLASGETIQTKLLVSLSPSYTYIEWIFMDLAPFLRCYLLFFFSFVLRSVQTDQTQWSGKSWGSLQSSGTMTSPLWSQCCTCQRWVLYFFTSCVFHLQSIETLMQGTTVVFKSLPK